MNITICVLVLIRGDSNEYLQHIFSGNMENHLLINIKYLITEPLHEKACLMQHSLISNFVVRCLDRDSMGRVKQIWYLSPM